MKHFFAHVMSSFRPLCIPIAVSSEGTRELDARGGVRARVRGRSRAMGDDEGELREGEGGGEEEEKKEKEE